MSAAECLNILLIEDNEDDYIIVRDLLRDIDPQKFTLEWANSYEEGLKAVLAVRHDLILLDFQLSYHTGLELLQETRSLSSRAPVIFMTGQGDYETDVQAMQSGAADYLVKDRLDSDTLERAIRYAAERHKSAAAIRAAEERYRSFVENSTEGIWRFELEPPLSVAWPEKEQIAHLCRFAKVAECNEAVARIYGFDCGAKVIGEALGGFLSPALSEQGECLSDFVGARYASLTCDAFIDDHQGKPKYISHALTGVVENGFLQRIWGTLSDITERTLAEIAQDDLAAIVSSSDAAIISFTLDGFVVTWNKGAEVQYGYLASEMIGQSIAIPMPPDRKDERNFILDHIRRGETVAAFETTRIRKDGVCLDVSASVSPIVNAHGEVTGGSSISHDISARKAAERLLQTSEANLAVAQRIAHFGSWEIELSNHEDINANPLTWSDETFRIFGYEPGGVPVTNDLFFQAVPPEEQPVIMQAVAAAIAERQPYSFVHRIRRPDGEERTVHEIAELFDGEATGLPARLIGTVHDITEQRRAEEHIRFQSLLLSQVRNAVMATDLTGKIIYWNSFAETMYQWKAEEVLGRNVAEVSTPQENQTAAEQVMSEIRETGSWQGEWVARRKDGSIFDVYVVDSLFSDSEGNVKGIVGVSVDITERKRAEEVRRQREQEFEALVENSPDIISRHDRQFRHLYVNRAIEQATGQPASVFIGKTHGELGMPRHLQLEWYTTLEEVFARGQEQETEFEFQTPSGTLYYHSRLVPEYAPDGRIYAILNVARDITRRKEAEEALRMSEQEQRELAEQLESERARLLAAQAVAKVGSWETDLSTMAVKWSAETFRIFEIAADQFQPTHQAFLEMVHPEDRTRVDQAFIQSLKHCETCAIEHRLLLPDGRIKFIEERWQTFQDDTGTPVRAVGTCQDITERRQAEEEHNRFFTLSLDMMCIANSDGYFTRLSPSWEATLGYSEAELLSRPLVEFVHPEDRTATLAVTQTLVGGATVSRFENRYLCKGGSYRWVSWRSASDPATGLIYGVARDVTEQKQNEQSLILQDQAIRASSNGIIVTDMRESDMPVVYVNPAFERITGYAANEVMGRNCRLLQGVETAQPELSNVRSALRAGETQNVTLRNFRKDGSLFWNELSLSPIYDDRGTLTHYVGVQNDVTDRKRAEEERDRFFTLSLDMLAIIGSDGYFKRLNPAFETTLGFSNAELMAKPFLEFVHPEDIPATLAEMAKLESGLQVMRFENRYICRDGSYKWLLWMCAPFGNLWYCAAHDVTAIKETAAVLRQVNEELETRVEARTQALQLSMEEAERANAAKSEFLSRMSHELRTPMNSILGFAQIMEMDAPSEKQSVRLGHIMRSGQHLLKLINEVLDTARVESGRLELSIETVSLSTTLRTAAEMIRPLCEPRDQRLVCDWAAWESLYVKADQQRLSQVLINLLSNAAKFNRDGGVILVQCEESGEGRLRVSVNDSGAGIPAGQIEKLFQPFERLDADKGAIEGTGLGLSLSKRLIELMGGTIGVESVVGTGSTFWVELPVADSPEQSPTDMPAVLFSTDADESRHTILSIEDNEANMQVIDHLLSAHPRYRLLSAVGALEGLKIARSERPSMILLDLHLPDLPGIEALSRLQSDPITQDIPVVIVSADATLSQIRRLMDAGAAEYLTKPLDVRLFLDVLRKLIYRKEETEV